MNNHIPLSRFLGMLFSRARAIAKLVLLAGGLLFVWQAQAITLTPLPPYLSETKGSPMVMLNMSRDHQLFYKAYNEYSDLDGDGVIETQYKHSYKYYGYFDNQRCYTYNTTNQRFVPSRKTDASGYCNYVGGSSEWSGNFMNWGTMTRMDVVRRILYGGMRSTDTIVSGASQTVLERAHLPSDAHAFAKYYIGADISKLTPFNKPEITMCNASFSNTVASTTTGANAPSIFVADGNYALWNANERWQCYWSEDKGASNGNNPATTGFAANGSNPSRSSKGLGTGYAQGSYTARVEVCKTGLPGGFTTDEDSRCKLYPAGNYKPVGLLQKYGEKNEAAFGLMTGSYDKNVSGGVLRKNVASFTDEVDLENGQFRNLDGIVAALNKLRVYGYSYGDGTYENLVGKCNFQQIGLVDGQCSSWGNPMGEIYLESLRYLAGKTANSDFTSVAPTRDASLGLTVTAWSDPFANSTVATFGEKLCRRSSIVNFNASVTTFDNDQWSGANSISGLSTTIVDEYTNQIGAAEGLYDTGKVWSIGRNGVDNNGFCSDKTIAATGTNTFANITGVCPEAPTQYGGYKIAGAALWAHTTPIRDAGTVPANNRRAYRVDTYSVALSTGTPRIKVPVPGQAGKFVFISPVYRLNVGTGGGGTLVDFKVISQTDTAGKYLVNWEDSEQGGDYDSDVLGLLEYEVVGTTISIKTYVISEATANAQGFGYAISGTNGKDGIHFHSGIRGFNYNDPRNITVTPTTNTNASGGCNNCQVAQTATTASYNMVGFTTAELRDPFWYAAKYGGFDRDKVPSYTLGLALPIESWDLKDSDGSTGADGTPDNYFYAVDPSQLEKSLEQVFSTILKAGGAAPVGLASRTDFSGYAYSSSHTIKPAVVGGPDADASGQFLRYTYQADGSLPTTPDWDAGLKLTVQNWDTGRKILTLSSTGPVPFRWTSLDSGQKAALNTNPQTGLTDTDAVGQNRLNWLRGDSTNETSAGGLRARPTTKLGAIINSTPWYVGPPSAGYSNADYGGGYAAFRQSNTATNAVFVAANDGMLHAIDGATGNELFAYVPRAMYKARAPNGGNVLYPKLSNITAKDFALNVGTANINMDGSVMAADTKVGGTWSTYLFGSFGRGAKGVYALDVARPQNVTEASTSVVKWEFSEAANDDDMGYIVGRATSRANGQPYQVGYMANNRWAAIYGNGYNSASGKAALFILFADGPAASTTTWTTGTHYIKIPVGAGGDNGMGTATAIDTDNDGVIDTIYAGDLQGNVWKFDVSNANPSLWKVATIGSVPLYQARTNITGTTTMIAQPITTVIQPFPHPKGGYQLVFGTGKSLESTDYPSAIAYTNTIYGIYDRPGGTTTLTVGLTDLVQKSTTFADGYRYIQNNTVDYSTKKGWYINLPIVSEGVVFNMIASDVNRATIKTLAPDGISDGCRIESVAIQMDLNPISGSASPGNTDGVTGVAGFSRAGKPSSNSFEIGRGGVIKRPKPPASPAGNVACTQGTTGCICNGAGCFIMCTPGSASCYCNAASTQCVYCTNPNYCNKPWEDNLCTYRTNSSGGNGIETVLVDGTCPTGRLTWREILRNR